MQKRILSLLFAILLVLLPMTGCDEWKPDGETTWSNGQNDPTVNGGGSFNGNHPSSEEEVLPSGSSFAIHFIDVGQADAALVMCDGKAMLIDGGNAGDSNLIYTYLQKHGVTHLDYVVCSHAHEDHVGGLSGALTYATVGTVFAPVKTADTKVFSNFVSRVEARGSSITVPQAGDAFSLGSASVTVLGPIKSYSETNNTSIVLRIAYGELSFLFTGDMESDAEADLIESGALLNATVLKVGHHGSETSSSYRFLKEVAPQYGIISVGTGNSYGHPNEVVLSRYRDAEIQLYRTDIQGDIVCKSTDGKTLTFTTAKNSDAITNPTEGTGSGSGENGGTEYQYVGNLESKKFHSVSCSKIPGEQNAIWFLTREEAIEAGYIPCGICDP